MSNNNYLSLSELLVRFSEFSPQIMMGGEILPEIHPMLTKSFNAIAPLDLAQHMQISFLTNLQYMKDLENTQALAVIINHNEYQAALAAGKIPNDLILIKVVQNAYALFAKLHQYFCPTVSKNLMQNMVKNISVSESGNIHPTAIIHPSAIIAKGVHIGPFVVIEENVIIGEFSHISSHCHLAKNTQVGANAFIYPNVQIYSESIIGAHVIIHSGSVIGSDGFGFAPYFTAHEKAWLKIPQIGHVVIEDDVEIGANCSIDRAAFNQTKIGRGSKLDNLIQIAHNVEIGPYCVIAGCTAIAGSTKIGAFSMIGGSSQIAGHLTIADKTTISGATSIMHSILEPGQHYTGVYPALPHALWKRLAAYLRRLIKKKD